MFQPVTVQSPRQESSVIQWVVHDVFSRDDVMILAGGSDNVWELGTVLAQTTSTGLWGILQPGGSGGLQTAAAVLSARAFIPAGVNTLARAVVRFAVVNQDALIWPPAITAPQIATAMTQLMAVNILGKPGL